MSVTATVSDDARTVTISVDKRFDFNVHKEFRDAYEVSPGSDMEYIVDMSGTDYMDSSALGMLLLLREHAGGDNSRIRIVNCNKELKNILTISNFQNLFAIE